MRNIILEKIANIVLPIMLLASLWLLLRGHNNPGGGFIAGIIASTGFIFYAIVFGTRRVKKIVRISTIQLMGFGLLVVFLTAILPFFLQQGMLTGVWPDFDSALLNMIIPGTPILFDIGVFLVVQGTILTIVFSIMEELKWN
jgi:multisubunit Na+/H+ antiporter MnhB subunit